MCFHVLSLCHVYFPPLKWPEYVEITHCNLLGYVVDGYDISIRTAPVVSDMIWTTWKKNYFLPEQARTFC
jgi:hypothetical protein